MQQTNTTLMSADKDATLRSAFEELYEAVAKIFLDKAASELQQESNLMPDGDLQAVLAGRLGGVSASTAFVNSVMATRNRQLNGVPLGNLNADVGRLVDTSKTNNTVVEQMTSIYMRYFCDPSGNAGKMSQAKVEISGGEVLTCGDSDRSGDANAGGSRAKTSRQGYQDAEMASYDSDIMNKPMKVNELFFATTTYPVVSSDSMARVNGQLPKSHKHPYAMLYYPAVLQSIEFLTGSAEDTIGKGAVDIGSDRGGYMERQARNVRKSLATYIFAMLAGDRVQSMGPDINEKVAKLLERSLGQAAQDGQTKMRLEDLRTRPGISMSEVMQILSYEIPSSPGYIEMINEMKPQELTREKVRLLGLQLAVDHQRNRYMEMLMALEATNK